MIIVFSLVEQSLLMRHTYMNQFDSLVFCHLSIKRKILHYSIYSIVLFLALPIWQYLIAYFHRITIFFQFAKKKTIPKASSVNLAKVETSQTLESRSSVKPVAKKKRKRERKLFQLLSTSRKKGRGCGIMYYMVIMWIGLY